MYRIVMAELLFSLATPRCAFDLLLSSLILLLLGSLCVDTCADLASLGVNPRSTLAFTYHDLTSGLGWHIYVVAHVINIDKCCIMGPGFDKCSHGIAKKPLSGDKCLTCVLSMPSWG